MPEPRLEESGGGDAGVAQASIGSVPLGRAADRLGLFEVPTVETDAAQAELLARDTRFRRLLALADAVAAAVALFVVSLPNLDYLQPAALVALPAIVLMAKAMGLYDRDELLLHKATLDEAPRIVQLVVGYGIFVWLFESKLILGGLDKVQFVALTATALATDLAGRAAARRLAHATAPTERVVFLGPERSYETIRGKLELGPRCGVELVGRHDLEDEDGEVLVAGRLGDLVRERGVHRFVIAPTATDSDAVLDLIREAKANRVKISLMPRFSEVLGSSVVYDDLHGIMVLAVRQLDLSRSSLMLKRLFDVTVASLSFVAVAPLMAVIAAAIKLTSPGPVLFRQTRIGLGGRPFQMLKFRTMVPEADELRADLEHLNEANGLFKIRDDPRMTRVGRLLRRTSLDELPQLINVLRGDMSIVGPRPLVAEDDRRIGGWYRQRLNIPPGMTGHWQVLGSARIPLEEMVAIDYLYVVNWSLWSDLKYLLRTVPFVLGLRGL
jgi:exopolysaccharide biosynthesis polyprenyl glycosylphosphotransferase